MEKKIYLVLDVKGKPGLTVGSEVIKPGGQFTHDAWPYGDESLKAAIKAGRCKEITAKKKAANSGNDKLIAKIEKMKKDLAKLNLETPGAKNLTEKIAELQKEIDA